MFKKILAVSIILVLMAVPAMAGKTVFSDGNPSLGVKGTRVTAAFLNSVNKHYCTGLDVDGDCSLAYAADTGAANAYVVTLSPALTQYVAGMPVFFKSSHANTGASTININGLGIKNIKKFGSAALIANDIPLNGIMQIVYDGTNFQLLNTSNYYIKGCGQIYHNAGINSGLAVSYGTGIPGGFLMWSISGSGVSYSPYIISYNSDTGYIWLQSPGAGTVAATLYINWCIFGQ